MNLSDNFHLNKQSRKIKKRKSSKSANQCVICNSRSIGINFGAMTCAPCKAFFRRNARRKELLEMPCRHSDLCTVTKKFNDVNEKSMRYLHIRRCSSCRLRCCFSMGMKEELIRTDEENQRYRQLIRMNRKRRGLLKQQKSGMKESVISRNIFNDHQLTNEIDWSHLSNIVFVYDTHCLKTFIQQRESIVFNNVTSSSNEGSVFKYPTTITMSIILGISSFVKSLPAYCCLPRPIRNYLYKTNLRPLIFPNIHELNQSCHLEPWQIAVYNATWKLMCGEELYEQFQYVENLAAKSWISDPIVIRLFSVLLFFSTPLHYHEDCPIPTSVLNKNLPIIQTQNAYATLLWKYLVYRHDYMESARIFSNLMHVYLKMQTVGYGINTQLRTQKHLLSIHETLTKLVNLNIK